MAEHIIRPIALNRTKNTPQHLHMYLTGIGPRPTTATAVWYIEGPEKKIVVDAGGSTEGAVQAMKMLAPDAIVEHIQSLDEGLKRLGLKPEDIDIVIVTHLHKDHIEFAHQFTRAKFIVQKAEYDFIDNLHPSVAPPFISKDFLNGLDIDVIEGDREIVEGVNVWLTPGHTPGGQSVVVDTAKGKAVITGFCCILQNFEPPLEVREMMPVITPGVHQDVIGVYDSVIRVKDHADIVIPVHDANFAEREQIP